MRNSFLLASALLRGNWLVTTPAAESHLPMLHTMLERARLHQDDDGAAEARELDPLFGCFAARLDAGTPQTYKTFDEAPAGSTAILSITGIILKDDFCDVGMDTKAEQIRTAYQHPNISSLLLKFDSPGGQANAPALAADAIREAITAGVPVLGWVDHGMAQSAAYWILASCSEAWLSQATDEVGSIGAYKRVRRSTTNDQVLEVYAPQSKQKNLPDRQAAAGDTKLLEAVLSDVVDVFIASVQADRGDRLTAGGDYFEGGTFMGTKALAAGLVDGICTFAAALARVQALAAEAAADDAGAAPAPALPAAPPLLTSTTLSTPSTPVSYPLLCALLGTSTLAFDKDKGSYLNAAQLDVFEQQLATAATAATDLSTARADLATRTSERDTARTDLTTRTTELKTATDKLATYANLPASETEQPKQAGGDRTPHASAAEDEDPELALVMAWKKETGQLPAAGAK